MDLCESLFFPFDFPSQSRCLSGVLLKYFAIFGSCCCAHCLFVCLFDDQASSAKRTRQALQARNVPLLGVSYFALNYAQCLNVYVNLLLIIILLLGRLFNKML